jgi:hypothetical protein
MIGDLRYSAVNRIEIDKEYTLLESPSSRKRGTLIYTVFLLGTGCAAVVLRTQSSIVAVYQLFSIVAGLLCLQTLLTVCIPSVYDTYFIPKGLVFASLLGASYSLPTYFPTAEFISVARICGLIYVFVQQLLLLDFAFSWNRDWVNRSSMGSRILTGLFAGSDIDLIVNSPWLLALLVVSAFYGACFVGAMAYLYSNFGGSDCPESASIIYTTSGLMLLALLIQLRGSSGSSVLTSGIVAVYASYLTYVSLSLNPKEACNPSLHHESSKIASTSLGVLFAFLTTAWTCVVTSRRLSASLTNGSLQSALIGITTGQSEESAASSWCGSYLNVFGSCFQGDKEVAASDNEKNTPGNSDNDTTSTSSDASTDVYSGQRVAIVNAGMIFTLIPLYLSMALSNWGTVDAYASAGSAEINPEVGSTSMWIQAAGLWCCLGLYMISLALPTIRILPRSIWDLQPRLM